MNEWRAHLEADWVRGGHRLYVSRYRDADSIEVLGAVPLTIRAEGSTPTDAGWFLPRGAWAAIEAIVQPSDAQREVARLEEALALERRRVDDILARTLREAL